MQLTLASLHLTQRSPATARRAREYEFRLFHFEIPLLALLNFEDEVASDHVSALARSGCASDIRRSFL